MNKRKLEGFPRLPRGAETSLSCRGYGIAKAGLPPDTLERLRACSWVSPSLPPAVSGAPLPRFRVALESRSKLYLPKALGLRLYGAPDEERTSEGSDAPGLVFGGGLRSEQEAAVGAYLSAARDPCRRGGIINAGCGNGKTVMALYIAAALGRRTLVVVHKEFLMNQWRERIAQFLPEATIGRIQGGVFDADKDVVLCMLQTLSQRKFGEGQFDGFGTVIVDECHHTSAEVFSRALHKINFRYSLGLSATVQRKDGLHFVFQWFLGEVCFRSRAAPESVDVRRARFESRDRAYCEESFIYGGKVNIARMVSNVCAFRPRTAFLAGRLVSAARERGAADGRCKVLVLSERRNHLTDIEREIRERFPGAAVGYYVGGLSGAQLKASEECAFILGTFAMAAEGMDIPSLDTLVLASPKSDIEQSVGRILRTRAAERAHVPLIIDVVDDFSIFASQAKKRKLFYVKKGYTCVDA